MVEENRDYGNIIGSSTAPYLNSLASTYRSATNWYAVQHTSLNDYLELLSGSNQGLASGTIASPSAPTLVDEQHAAGVPWQAYMESMPSTPCWNGKAPPDGLYVPIHNPFHYFTNYTTNSGGWCSTNLSTEGVLTYPGSSGLLTALSGTNAPDLVQISPNDCNDMQGDANSGSRCATSTNAQLVSAGDTWLSNNIQPVIQSTWFQQGGFIILMWDEGTTKLSCCSGVDLLQPLQGAIQRLRSGGADDARQAAASLRASLDKLATHLVPGSKTGRFERYERLLGVCEGDSDGTLLHYRIGVLYASYQPLSDAVHDELNIDAVRANAYGIFSALVAILARLDLQAR